MITPRLSSYKEKNLLIAQQWSFTYLGGDPTSLGVVVVALLGAAGHELGENGHAAPDERHAREHDQPELPVEDQPGDQQRDT